MSIVSLGDDSLLLGRRRRRRRRRRDTSDYQPEESRADSPASVPAATPSTAPEEPPAPREETAPPPEEPAPEGQEAPQTMGRGGRRVSLRSFIKSFRRMNKAQRRAAWRAIPKAQKAAWLFIAGPVLLPLIAAAGVAVTATAAAMGPAGLLVARAAMAKRRRKRTKYPRTLFGFIREFKKMGRDERREAWKSIPRARKAAWLILAGPVLLPLIAAAGIVVTSTAAAAPFALIAVRARIAKRRKRLAQLRAQQEEAHRTVVTAQVTGNVTAAAKAIVVETNAKSEIATETNALKSDEDQVSSVHKDAGGTGEEEKTPEVSSSALDAANSGGVKKKSNVAALVPLGALAALMFL